MRFYFFTLRSPRMQVISGQTRSLLRLGRCQGQSIGQGKQIHSPNSLLAFNHFQASSFLSQISFLPHKPHWILSHLCLHQTQHLIPSLYCCWTSTAWESTPSIPTRPTHTILHPSAISLPFHPSDSRLVRFIWAVLALPFQYHILKYPPCSLCFRNSFSTTLHYRSLTCLSPCPQIRFWGRKGTVASRE